MDVKSIISQMTLEEKAALCSGKDFWHLDTPQRLGIESVMVSDGPCGIRKQSDAADHLGLNASVPATSYPTGSCMARDLPILFHMGDARSELSAPKKLVNVLEKLPELKCIAAHLGGYQRWDEAKACLKGANVWVDTSSSLFVLNPDEARRSIEHFGMDKVMFGTDFPMWTHEKELERFFALGYGEEENRKMLYDNFEKLFKL